MPGTFIAIARAPMRVDPAGGGTDCPPFSVEHGGALVNFGITRYVHARVEMLAGSKEAVIRSEDLNREVHANSLSELKLDGNLDLLKAVAKRMKPVGGFRLSVASDVPPGSGLGSSGAVGVACVGAFDEAMGTPRTQEAAAELANDIERTDCGNVGGNQDSFGAALGGMNFLTYHKGGGTSARKLRVPEEAVLELERRCVLVYTGEVHLSGSIHQDIKRSYALPESPTVDAMKNLARVARESAEALEACNVDRFGALLNENWVHHKRLHESCDSATLKKFYAAAQDHITGGKTCGAGGGGCVLFLAKDGHRKALERACEDLGGRLLPFGIDRKGLLRWRTA
ncbi:MAG: hypothetical protein HY291_11330 [Planctomycetes bacterium]|nr:hypothetical protein [Planctomycetota bacterium]